MEASALTSAEYWLSWIWVVKLIAAGLVAAGVVLEFGSEWISRPFEETVKHAREVQLATLEAEAETARARQKEAEERTEELRASIQRNVSPRRITAPEAFQNALKGLPPATVEILYDPSTIDGALLASSITVSLKIARWTVEPGNGLGIAPFDPAKPEPVSGVPDLQLPPVLSGKIGPWGITILANRRPRENDPTDPINALQKAISDAKAENLFSVGVDEQLPDNKLRVVIEHRAPSYPGPRQPAGDASAPDAQKK